MRSFVRTERKNVKLTNIALCKDTKIITLVINLLGVIYSILKYLIVHNNIMWIHM